MKTKNLCLIVLLMISAFLFFACGVITGPDGNDHNPKPKSVTVKYVRVQPVPYPEAMDRAFLNWDYGSYQGGAGEMPKIAEDTFQLNGVTIQTETPVTIRVYDAREYNGSSYEVCKILYIDDIELAVAYTYGQVKFIYGNDGSIKVVT